MSDDATSDVLRKATEGLDLWHNGIEWVVAKDPDDARAILHATTGEKCQGVDPLSGARECCDGTEDWHRVDGGEFITVHDYQPNLPPQKHSARVWVAMNGCGFLCSSEW